MQALVFRLIYPILWAISKLPFPFFYRLSDAVYFLVYYITGYRKKVVVDNLKLAFPEKSTSELKKIRKKFYRHMCDMFLEMIKSISISEEEMVKRFQLENPEEYQRLKNLNKNLIIMCGHYASYEWMNALQLQGVEHQAYGVYKKIKNPHFDKMAREIRGRYDGVLIPTSMARKFIAKNEEKDQLSAYAMISDQSPKRFTRAHWAKFMGIRVPVFMGSELLAREHDIAVVYLKVDKIKRGHYKASLIPISEAPQQEESFYITRKFIDLLEKQIREKPELYLWTHKRWKHMNREISKDSVIID
ncbi:lysophospholipid acyltransferase family protein [Salegentibacter sp. HM20]